MTEKLISLARRLLAGERVSGSEARVLMERTDDMGLAMAISLLDDGQVSAARDLLTDLLEQRPRGAGRAEAADA